MIRRPQKILISETDEAVAPTRDVLLAVSGALRGDRKRVRLFIAKAQARIEKRLRRELRTLGRNKPAPTRKKQKIRGAHLSPPKRLPPLAPYGAVEARLPDGRKLRLVITPVAARHRDMLALKRVSAANTKRAYDAIAHNGRAIDQLAASQRELADRLAKQQSNGDLALLRGIVEGLASLERRVEGVKRRQDRALGAHKRSVQKQFARQARALTAQTRATQIQKLHGAVASMQSAAYGTRGRLVSTNNVLLAANQLGWSYAPQIFEALGLAKPGSTSPLAWLAPSASLVASRAVLGRRQHERFISGVVRVPIKPIPASTITGSLMVLSLASMRVGGLGEKTFSLKNHIAPAEWGAFAKRTDVTVTTAILEPPGAFENGIWISGQVSGGNLTVRILALSSDPTSVVVSWTVDTRRPDG